MFKVIVATDHYGCIGLDNKLPWHFPEDLKYFQKMTTGCPVIMGHNTFKSLQSYGMEQGFKDRKNIVITSDPKKWTLGLYIDNRVTYVSTLEAAKVAAKIYSMKLGNTDMWIVGGRSIYEACMQDKSISELHWSVVGNGKDYDGDTYLDLSPLANRLGLHNSHTLSDNVYVNVYKKEE